MPYINSKGTDGHQSLSASLQVSAVDVTDDENFGLLLESTSCVSGSISKVGAAKSKSSQQINHMTLSKKWGISPEKAVGLELFTPVVVMEIQD